MDFQLIVGWKSLPEAGFGITLLLMLIDEVVLAFTWIILTWGRPVVQDHSKFIESPLLTEGTGFGLTR